MDIGSFSQSWREVMKGGGELLEPAHWGRETVSLQKVNSWCHGSKAYFKTLVIGLIKIL